MNVPGHKRPLHLVIREVGVTAASPLEARRLANALPAALERALARLPAYAPRDGAPRQRPVDRVAAQIASIVAEKLRARP